VNQSLVPKVQFNLELSEKERTDRANVVLPFEHQGKGEPIQIYDGRRSLPEGQRDPNLAPALVDELVPKSGTAKGEIYYVRDSDDEQPDSDEDPDDDLDI
jgi:elongator complex protein 5